MGSLIASRLLFGLASLTLLATVLFWSLELLPGDFASAILGRDATPERLDEILREPMVIQNLPVGRGVHLNPGDHGPIRAEELAGFLADGPENLVDILLLEDLAGCRGKEGEH